MPELTTVEPAGAVAASDTRARRRVPAPLAALLAASLLLGLAWSFLLPGWQAPDENSHYGYVQSLVDGPGLPGEPDRPAFATEQSLAADSMNADQTAAALITRPEWNRSLFDVWKQADGELASSARSDGGGANAARSNPPAAYLFYAVPYLAASGGTPFDRLVAMRMLGVLWLLVTVAATWALAGEVFGPRASLQLTAAAIPALGPMSMFITASVTPDGMLFATWTVALWLGARLLRRGFTMGGGFAFLLAVGVACLVKATSYALLPGALLVFAIALWRARSAGAGTLARWAAPGVAALVATVGGWVLAARLLARPASEQLTSVATASGLNVRELGSYLWQFYLPRLPFMQDFFSSTSSLPLYETVLKGTWARFGWLEVVFPEPVYWLLSAFSLVILGGALTALWRARRTLDRAVLAFFALVLVTLVAGLHWQEYRLLLGGTSGFMQGRYVLPLVGLAGLVAAAALTVLPPRRRALGATVLLGGMFAVQIFSLGLIVERFYA